MNKLKLGLVAVLMFNLVGCAAMSEKEGVKIFNSNHVVIYKVTKANLDAKEMIVDLKKDKLTPNADAYIASLGGEYEVGKNYNLHSGLLKYTYSKTFYAGVFLPKSVEVNNGDLIMGSYNSTGNIVKFIKIVARKGEDNKSCYWDGSGVICPQENWDYRKDLPEAMK